MRIVSAASKNHSRWLKTKWRNGEIGIDRKEASEYATAFENLRTNQINQGELMAQQISTLELTKKVIKRNFEQIEKEHGEIRRQLGELHLM